MAWRELKPDDRVRDEPAATQAQCGVDAANARAACLRKCDARSIWATVCNFRSYSPTHGKGVDDTVVPVAVEVFSDASKADKRGLAIAIGARGIYRRQTDLFWTGAVAGAELQKLACFRALKGWRIGLHNIPDSDASAHGSSPSFDLTAFSLKPALVIGIIDHGIAVAHPAFRWAQGGKPRLIKLWDQDPGRRAHANDPNGNWAAVAGLGYGGELTGATLERLVAANGGNERRIYEQLQYAPVQGRLSHGTHVLDIAAGAPNPMRVRGQPAVAEAASQARIIAVQLPYRPAKDASGSALCVHVLDALHYIERNAPAHHRVVINLSDGAYGGPHDGGSMLERAIDRFLLDHPRVTLVLAAGNAHEMNAHVRFDHLKKGETAAFDWHVMPDDSTDSFIEIWFDKSCPAGSMTLQLTPPGGLDAAIVPLGQSHVFHAPDGQVIAAVIGLVTNPDSPDRSMFLVAVAPTRWNNATAPHGIWQVAVKNESMPLGSRFDAWIERDNPVINESGPRRQSFIERPDRDPGPIDGQGTLGSLAGSAQAFVVGGCYRRGETFGGGDARQATSIARYSSRGPARAGPVQGPDLIAPSDESPVLHGLRAAANRNGATFRMDGTSVAAPIVARRILNLLGGQHPPSTRAALEAQLLGSEGAGPDPELTGARGRIEPATEPPSHGTMTTNLPA